MDKRTIYSFYYDENKQEIGRKPILTTGEETIKQIVDTTLENKPEKAKYYKLVIAGKDDNMNMQTSFQEIN